jgi:hypothetical protein
MSAAEPAAESSNHAVAGSGTLAGGSDGCAKGSPAEFPASAIAPVVGDSSADAAEESELLLDPGVHPMIARRETTATATATCARKVFTASPFW